MFWKSRALTIRPLCLATIGSELYLSSVNGADDLKPNQDVPNSVY